MVHVLRHLPWYENSRWLLPDVAYAHKHRERGHTFGWWSRAEAFARKGKQIIDSSSLTGEFKRATNQTFTFLNVEYVGFCRRFSPGISATIVRPPQCQYTYLPESEVGMMQKVGAKIHFALNTFKEYFGQSFGNEKLLDALKGFVKDQVVLVLGAGVGSSALWFAQQGAKSVLAMEYSPVLFEALCRNIAANVDVQVLALRAALGARDEDFTISESMNSFQAQVVSISSLRLQAIELEEVGLVKIDLDRSLPTSLPLTSSFVKFLRQTQPILWMSKTSPISAGAMRQLRSLCRFLYSDIAERDTLIDAWQLRNLSGDWRSLEASNILCMQRPLRKMRMV